MKERLSLLLIFCCIHLVVQGQVPRTSIIFAHNDYARDVPFFEAYDLKVGYIEADVFLENGDLLVGHDRSELHATRTLEKLYLEPLREVVRKNDGNALNDGRPLTLMIDLKTSGVPTLNAIIEVLAKYPELTSSATLNFMISGDVPNPALWHNYPPFISFDGRPGIDYSTEQWPRIDMISTSFRSHIHWDGTGKLPSEARAKMDVLIAEAHKQGKKFRFWATPDLENAWQQFLDAGMDVIVTDKPAELAAFLKNQSD